VPYYLSPPLSSRTDNNYHTFFDASSKTREPARASLKELCYNLKNSGFFFSIEKKKFIKFLLGLRVKTTAKKSYMISCYAVHQ
jgi:hypothetical protein